MTIEQPTAELFDSTGATSIGALTNARNIQWQDVLSQQGSASFEIPLDDTITASITDRCIVKFSLYGSVRFACRIVTESVQIAVDGTRWLSFQNQPGLLQLLADAVVFPEYGLDRASQSTRTFGFMSIDGAWRVSADWQNPVAVAMSADVRGAFPPDLVSTNPDWIAFDSPDTTQAAGTTNYFRFEFTLSALQSFWFAFTGDNFMTLYIDGDEIVSPDPTRPYGWKTTSVVQMVIAAGDHVLAAKVVNAALTWGTNPMGLVGTIFLYDTNGNRAGAYAETNSANWLAHDDSVLPGWTRAQVLKQLVLEAQARSVYGPSQLALGFTDTHDTDSVAWADAPDQYDLSVGTVNLSDVASQLSESGIDVAVDPVTMTLNSWVRKGSDLSGSVELKLGDSGAADASLKSHTTTSTVARFTDVIAQAADGTWTQTTSSAGVTAIGGHVEVGLSLSSVSANQSAVNVALAQLAESAQPQIGVTSEPSALVGAQAYIDYDLGDTITVPAHRNAGTTKSRVLAITVDATGDVISVWPQFIPDGSV